MSSRAIATLAGCALAAGHLLVLPLLIDATARAPLEVTRRGPRIADAPSLDAVVPPGVAVETSRDGDAPGLVWTRWTARYRGGVVRSVGAVQLVGPFQDPGDPPCSARLAVGQRLLDDGHAGDGTVAAIVASELTAALRGTEHFTVGSFRRVEAVRVRWVEMLDDVFFDLQFAPAAMRAPRPTGYLRADAIAVFDRVRVPVTVGAIVRFDHGAPSVVVAVRANLEFGSRVLDWVNDQVGGDAMVSKLARGQLDAALLGALGPPPPLELPGGRTLIFEPCPGRAVEVHRDAWAAVPLRWHLGSSKDGARPPSRGAVRFAPPAADAAVTLDLDLDGVNGLLYELWRDGWLGELVDRIGVHDRFNRDPVVREYLTLSLAPVALSLPPTVSPAPGAPDRLRLALALDTRIADGATVTPATAWGALDIGLGATRSDRGPRLAADVGVSALEVTCEPSPGRLRPCYGDIVAAVRDAARDTHATLGAALADALDGLFVDQRLAAAGAPAALVIDGVAAEVHGTGGNAAVRVTLAARLSAAPSP